MKRLLSIISLLALLASLLPLSFLDTPTAQASWTYRFRQSDWSGGQSANYPSHPANESTWTYWGAKDTNLAAGADLKLAYDAGGLSARTDVTQDSGYSSASNQNVTIAVSPSTGVVYAVYLSKEYNSSYYNIAYRNSSNWVTRTDVTTDTSGKIPDQKPSVTIDSSGVVHVAYVSTEYNSVANIAYRNSSNWATRTDVTTDASYSSSAPSITVNNSSGVKHIVYSYNNICYDDGYGCVYSPNIAYRNSSNWSNQVNVTSYASGIPIASVVSSAIDSSGTVHLAYSSREYNASYNNIAYRNSSNWTARTDVTTSTSKFSYAPSLAVDSSGVKHIAYHSNEYNASYNNIAYRNSSNWATRTDVTTDASYSSSAPSITVNNSSGVKHIVYSYNNICEGDGYGGCYYYPNIAYRNSSNWSNQVNITSYATYTVVTYPISSAIDSSGTVHLDYSSKEYNSSYYNIAYRNSSNWATRTDVTTNTGPKGIQLFNMAVDSSGVKHVVYLSKEYNSSYYNIAYRNSSNWAARTDVTTNASNVIPWHEPSVAVDSSGVVHIAYLSKEYNSSYYNIAYRNSSNWAARTDVTTDTSGKISSDAYPSLAVDSSGVKHIIYQSKEYNSSYYNIAYRNSSNWTARTDVTTDTLGKISSDAHPSLAVDSSGVKHVFYYSKEYNGSCLNIAYRNSSNWATRTDVTTNAAYNIYAERLSIAVDSSGVRHIAYASIEYNSYNLNIVYRNSSNWATRTDVTTIGGQGMWAIQPSLVVDSSGVKHIAYASSEYSSIQNRLNIAYRNSSNWATRTDVTTYIASVDADGSSLAIDSSGVKHIFYYSYEYNSNGHNIAYKYLTPPSYPPLQTLTSSAYNTRASGNVLAGLNWSESLLVGTDVKLQLQTAPDSSGVPGTWSAWCGPDDSTPGSCSSATYFTNPAGGETIDDIQRDGSSDQWFRWQATLTSTGANTPTLDNVIASFTSSVAPEVARLHGITKFFGNIKFR